MFELTKRKYQNQSVEEIAKEAVNSKHWNSKTSRATELRDVIAIRIANEQCLSMDTQFDAIMDLTNKVIQEAANIH